MKIPGLDEDSTDLRFGGSFTVQFDNLNNDLFDSIEVLPRIFEDDTYTILLANRDFNAGDAIHLYTGAEGLSATEISFYFSDGYESTAAFDGEADSWEVISSRFVEAFPEDPSLPPSSSPLARGQISGPFDFADPQLVPEPGALALFLTALFGLGAMARAAPRRLRPTLLA